VPRGALRRVACLPESLRKAIETPLVAGYGQDDSDKGGGINLIAGKWEPPTNPTSEELAAARLWMQAYGAETATVAAKDLEKWIATLVANMRLSSGAGEDDIEMRIRMLSLAVDERAAKHFSKDALKLAWKKFGQFIPTASQLMEFFDDLESLERTQAQRLMAVLDAGYKTPPPKAPAMDVDESMRRHREKQERERKALAAIVEAKYGAMPPMPERQLGESDDAFLARLKHWRTLPRLPLPEPATEGATS
jgi:hypothetical protein